MNETQAHIQNSIDLLRSAQDELRAALRTVVADCPTTCVKAQFDLHLAIDGIDYTIVDNIRAVMLTITKGLLVDADDYDDELTRLF